MKYERKMTCLICNNSSGNREFKAKEMMMGTREDFRFFQCENCQSIQLIEIPKKIGKYYSDQFYYSFDLKKRNFLKSLIDDLISKKSYKHSGFLFRLLDSQFLCELDILSIGKLNPKKNWKILDVGCGSGQLLQKLKKMGFSDIQGIDPFISKDYLDPVKISKTEIKNLEDYNFDLIMFHHSLEHVSDPLIELIETKKRLKENGIIILRLPIVSKTFDFYKESWFQIDAPRHFFIPSLKSIKILISTAGLKIKDYYFDSTPDQFLISDQYKKNISMKEFSSELKSIKRKRVLSTPKEMKKEVKKLNFTKDGDQACFYIIK